MEFLQDLAEGNLVVIILAAVGLFAAISRVTPNKTDDKIVNFLLKLINVLGLKNKNGGSGVGKTKVQ